eukprot:CAMPEP_0172473588 /NCGR_PEP_ID=MMETSP1065-20121228/68932_1 /TAXON_ID=265537 /ORGANISM="Amphiprora paludosa, Strain CCMP125" /LENGTH=393 /DNA_ID=CAMNT_0013231763 /DNA_START=41 /DNA_END=1222 /DNA_ORIENTATION=-
MAAVGRIFSRDHDEFDIPPLNNENTWHSVTELISWFRNEEEENKSNDYENKHFCRFRGGFHNIDLCSNKKLVYVNPWLSDDGWTLDGDLGQPVSGNDHIVVYPMVDKQQMKSDEDGIKYFPSPISRLECKDPVTALQVSALGDVLIVATVRGKIQLWNVETPQAPRLTHSISCLAGLKAAYSQTGRFNEEDSTTPPNYHPSSVEEIYVSRHLPVEKTGFVTLQHGSGHGSSLMHWKLNSAGDVWEVRAQIDLPLSSSRFPQIYFDGRKIVVLSQDQIGYLLLVYQVKYTNDDLGNFGDKVQPGVAASGGVVNFGSTCVRFAQRIRHAALGGLEAYHPVHMTCNERFIVVATKMGHFVGGSLQFLEDDSDTMVCNYSDGLLLIDLQKKGRSKKR